MEETEENKIDFEFIESYLVQFKGGEIFISKEYWDEGIAIVYLNHPEKRNAISGKMMVDFHKCVEELEKWKEGKSVLLCGLGVNFCSGGDLDFAKAAGTPKDGFYMSYIMQNVLKRFRKLPLVTVTLVHGPTLGGGAEMGIFSDYILAADNVKLGFVHGKMGIITAFGGSTRLLQILGERKALELLLTSKILDAKGCLDVGLAYKLVNTENRMQESLNFIRRLIIFHASIVHSFKQVFVNSASENFEDALIYERKIFSPTWGSELNQEALNKNIRHLRK